MKKFLNAGIVVAFFPNIFYHIQKYVKEAMDVSDPKLVSPLLDNYVIGEPISQHYGVRSYPAMQKDSDRKYIARHEVLGGVRDFCAAASRLLKHGGRFYCVWRPDRLTELMWAMRDNRIEQKNAVFIHADAESEPSMVLIAGTKGGGEGMRIMPPILLHPSEKSDGGRRMTARAQRIYETMSFYD